MRGYYERIQDDLELEKHENEKVTSFSHRARGVGGGGTFRKIDKFLPQLKKNEMLFTY